MAQASLTTSTTPTCRQLIDAAILEDLAADITLAFHEGIEDRPKAFDAFTRATVAMIQPGIEALARAYLQASATPAGRNAARAFLHNLLDAEE